MGYWHVGVPPSGPMDSYSFRLANALVGNPEDAAGLEISLAGAAHFCSSDGVLCPAKTGWLPALKDDWTYLLSLAVLAGPSLKFHTAAVVALCGAHFAADVDGEPVPFWQSFAVEAGSTLAVGAVSPATLVQSRFLDGAHP